ncbi:ABC transporter permease, partial [Variovorax sp. 2RAF20]
LGRALAARGWYGFLVGLSAVNPLAAREILGAGYNGGIVLTQIAPGPQDLTLRVVKEHVGRMKQFLDEPASPATLAGYIGAAWL